MTMVTGIGSWPGTDIRETVRMVRDLLTTPAEGVVGLPYLPELPARGPGADLVGRGLSLLVDLPVDLQPSGWRLTDRPGRDLGRSEALMRQDLDELAEAFDGWTSPFKVQVTGPWTLAASTWLPRGERVLSDEGATREVVDSLAEGVRQYLARVARLLPGANLVLQVDEPSLPAALEGRLPTASGFGMVRTVEPQVAVNGLSTVLRAAPDGTRPVVHCCAPGIPVALVRQAGADLSTDTSLLTGSTWEGVAVGLEEGMTLYAGSVPTTRPSGRAQDVASALAGRWAELGLSRSTLADLVVTPACGLAGLTPEAARNVSSVCIDVAAELAELAQA